MILTNVTKRTLMIQLNNRGLIKILPGETIDSSKLPSGENHYFVKKQWLAQNDLSKSVSCEQENSELKNENIHLEQKIAELEAKLANAKKAETKAKAKAAKAKAKAEAEAEAEAATTTKDSDEEETQEPESKTEEQVNE